MPEAVILNNRYILEKTLGRGGMATVYQARDRTLERTVAIKLLREDYSRDPAFRARFHQEAKAAANLIHPNIVTVYDFGIDEGRLYIVMEYVPGADLNTLLQKRGRFTVEETLPLMRQACAGVGYAHRAGLIHCDIKPHNLLITPDNRLKVTDFGIARALETINPNEHNGVVWGSPQYFSPEQAAGKSPTPASDVYSLGVVLYYMLTGRLPFVAPTAAETARMHRFAEPPPPTQFNPAIPPALEAIILKVLSKEPAQRYRTADQFGRVLMTLESAEQVGYEPLEQPIRRFEGERADTIPPISTPVRSLSQPQAPQNQRQPFASAPGAPAPRTKTDSRPISSSRSTSAPPLTASPSAAENPLDIDWITLGIGLLAVIAVGGLIPLWLWIYLLYFPPTP